MGLCCFQTGPLPLPPRSMFDSDKAKTPTPPPPRPPRIASPPPPRSPARKAFEMPMDPTTKPTTAPAKPTIDRTFSDFSITAVSEASSEDPLEHTVESPNPSASSHIREGAFSPSTPSDSPVVETVPDVRLVEPKEPPPADDSSPPLPPVPDKDIPRASLDSAGSTPVKRLSAGSGSSRAALVAQRFQLHDRPESRSDHSSGHSRSPSLSRAVPSDTETLGAGRRSGSGGGDGSPVSLQRALSKWKRFSALPRPPSRQGSARRSASSRYSSRTPSPSTLPPIPGERPRIVKAWPEALQFADVTNRKSCLERSLGYAQKINELAMYDCGLADWVTATRTRGAAMAMRKASTVQLAGAASKPFIAKARIISDGSVSSQATFPLRHDSFLATDLGVKVSADLPAPSTAPPSLPYPSLAANGITRPGHPTAPPLLTSFSSTSSTRSTPLSNVARTAGGFLFSSIGRKSSAKKEVPRSGLSSPVTSAPGGGQRLHKATPMTTPTNSSTGRQNNLPQAAMQPAPHGVVGGPRAPPGRAQRSQTLMLSRPPEVEQAASAATKQNRRSSVLRRQSVFARASEGGSGPAPAGPRGPGSAARNSMPFDETNPDFRRQIDKLADLLPHAERGVLAGYLRRAGSDMIALGQYIEDEKSRTIRRD